MNKKEILEIKKQYTSERFPLLRICGCYVDADKNKQTEFVSNFLSLDEEDIFKYLEIFRNILSGKLEKNLQNMQFPLESEEKDAPQHLLLGIRDSKLKNPELLEEFYDRVIESYNYAENYLILLGYAVYDIPGKGTDNTEQLDSSDEIFEHILCCICPVHLSKPCLSYQKEKDCFESRKLDWIVEKPSNGFLFPAFNDRTSDIHGALYYAKKPEENQDVFIVNILGCEPPFTAGNQKKAFQNMIKETLGDQCNFFNVLAIHENLFDKEYLNEDATALQIQKNDIRNILGETGAPDDHLANFDGIYKEATYKEVGIPCGKELSFALDNITDTKKLEIKTEDFTLQVNAARTDLIQEKIVDGKRSIVIIVEGRLELEGVEVKPQEK